jgi:adenylate kinase
MQARVCIICENFMTKPVTIIMFGPAGSGKGTQVDLLKQKLNLEKIEIGSLIRQRIETGDELGKKFENITSQGKRLSDNQALQIIKDAISQLDASRAIIFDGYPRSPGQAEQLSKLLKELDRAEVVSISIIVSDGEATRRLLSRSVCEKGHIFLTRDIQICPHDATSVAARYDDTEESVAKRLKWYHDEIVPAIDYFRDKGQFFEINGQQSIEDVNIEIEEKLKSSGLLL